MHASHLAMAVNPSLALCHSRRRPGRVEVDDEATPVVQVESLGGGVGREQHPRAAHGERRERVRALGRGAAAVQYLDRRDA